MIQAIRTHFQIEAQLRRQPTQEPTLKMRIAEAVGRALGHLVIFSVTLATSLASIVFGTAIIAITLPTLVIALPVILALKALGFYNKQPQQPAPATQTVNLNVFGYPEKESSYEF